MAMTKKGTRYLTWLLAVLLAAVWGEIGYRLLNREGPQHASTLEPAVRGTRYADRGIDGDTFTGGVRDPFAYHVPAGRRPATSAVAPRPIHAWSPPPVSLEGIVLGAGKRTAVLTDASGHTYFLTKGDTLDGIRVVGVSDRKVTYRYDRKDTSWVVGSK